MADTIIFCVDNYSISFVKTEIEFLSKQFKKVIVVSEENSGPIKIDNVDLHIINYSDYKTYKLLQNNLSVFLTLFFSELFTFPKYIFYPKKNIDIASNLLRSIYIKDQLKKIILDQKSTPLTYTFWFNNWANAMSILVREKTIANYYASAHGTDLYEERVPVFKRIIFRKFQLKYVSKVFSVSKKGELYLKNKYPQYAHKIYTSYLGTTFSSTNPFISGNVFTLVSCARIRNIKRIHLLAEIVSRVDFPLKWIHIGNENLNSGDPTIPAYLSNKEKIKTNKNVELVLTGDLSNDQVLKLYGTTPINLFVSVSETEGLPVSMMEAISFGIPILSTDVGGCSEIVTDQTGMLIAKDFDIDKVLKIISEFKASPMNSVEFREKTQKFWQAHFDKNTNGSNFIKLISNN